MTLLIVAVAAFIATFSGGLFALRTFDKRYLVLAFSAGAVVAVALFELLPEAIVLGSPSTGVSTLLTGTALGFLGYLVLDRIQWLRAHLGAGAGGLSMHSMVDGVAIGLAFQASRPAGMVLTAAVLVHDFSDGINTASVVLRQSGDRSRAIRWLWVDALAPGIGLASTALFSVPPGTLGMVLAVLSGFFLYIGASDLVPESFRAHPRILTTLMTLAGAAAIYVVNTWASH